MGLWRFVFWGQNPPDFLMNKYVVLKMIYLFSFRATKNEFQCFDFLTGSKIIKVKSNLIHIYVFDVSSE